MFNTITIKILKADYSKPGSLKELYRNSVSIAKEVKFDYGLFESAFSLLYPDCLIQFTID